MSIRNELAKNPLRLESKRAFRRFFLIGNGHIKTTKLAIGVLGAAYVSLLLIFGSVGSAIDPAAMLVIELFLAGIAPVLCFYASIAGEREKRTWDILRVAPISERQIVLGKFSSNAQVLTLFWAAALPFVGISSIEFKALHPDAHFSILAYTGLMLLGSLLPLVFAWLSLAITLFFSAVARRPLQALTYSFGTIFGWTVALPAILTTFPGLRDGISALVLTLNPMVGLFDVITGHATNGPRDPFSTTTYSFDMWLNSLPDGTFFVSQILLFLVFIFGILAFTRRALIHVDREQKFSVVRKHA